MAFFPTIALRRRTIHGNLRVSSQADYGERLVEISSWIMVLGTIRLTCTFADYLDAYLNTWQPGLAWTERLARFIRENHPLFALSAVWPLVLGLALRRTQWRALVKAVAFTFLILSISGLLALTASWNQKVDSGITIGSFHLSSYAFLHPSLSDILLGMLGTAQLVLESWTALRAIQLMFQRRICSDARPDRHLEARRARFGRLAVYASVGYLVLMSRLPLWSAYVELLDRSRWIRELVLLSDLQRIRSNSSSSRISSPEMAQLRDFQTMMNEATQLWHANHFAEAKDRFIRLVIVAESLPPVVSNSFGMDYLGTTLNLVAWLLLTCPDESERQPRDALDYARRAVERQPDAGEYWNTLGVAHYRAENWSEATKALKHSMELRNDGDSFDWFFLAMIESRLGHPEPARLWYDKAVEWFHHYRPGDRELWEFQVEAARVLRLPEPDLPPASRVSQLTSPPSYAVPGHVRSHPMVLNPRPRPR
jgi:hypothetical protein